MLTPILIAAIALGPGGMGGPRGADGCDPLPAIAVSRFALVTPGSASLDPAHAVLQVRVPLLAPPMRAYVWGRGVRVVTGVMQRAAGLSGAVEGDREQREAALPALRAGTRYDVALGYVEPTPEGCAPPPPSLIGSVTTP
ncbi:MAG: hypothetical protein KGM44_05975 [bacterium]|nr:hypothetical protein [bacterium]